MRNSYKGSIMGTLELKDGQIIVTYDRESFEIDTIEDWNGDEVSLHWERVALERVEEMRFEYYEAMADRYRERDVDVYLDLKREGY